MTDQQILERAIQKAIDGGWKPNNLDPTKDIRGGMKGMTGHVIQFKHGLADYRAAIFSHDFAKALWGERLTCQWCGRVDESKPHDAYCECPGYCDAWQYHLQQMVTAEDPIKYLGDHLDD